MTALDRLRAHLATLTAEDLRRHLDARPDVLRGAPLRDLDDLAERLTSPAGAAAAIAGVSWPHLQILEVLAASGAGASERRSVELLDATHAGDPRAHARAVGRLIAELRAGALVWQAGEHLDVNPGVRTLLTFPLGLGRSVEGLLADVTAAELTKVVRGWGRAAPNRKADLLEAVAATLGDPVQVRRLVAAAPAEVAEYLLTRAQQAARNAGARVPSAAAPDQDNEPGGQSRDPAYYRRAQVAATWTRANGLGFSPWSAYSANVEIPGEVMLALVPAGTGFRFDPDPPPLPRAPVSGAQVTSSAAGALTVYLSTAMATLEALARVPLATLKAGGVGVREMTALAKRLGVDGGDIRLTLELAAPLGLLGEDRAGKLHPAPRFEEWRVRAPADRAADLMLIWLGLDGTPTIDRDEDDRSIPALGAASGDGRARARRAVVLAALGAGEANTGLVSPATLARFIGWRTPVALQGGSVEEVTHIWAEAERLGVAAHGTLSDVGRAALAGSPGPLLAALTDALPPVQRTALFGSDLTVVVPGSPDAAVVDLLDAAATREARGAASTWRITPESVRRALDDGFEASDLLDRLRALADGALPQALDYLVRDVGRRYGAVQVRPAGAVLAGDEALLAEIEVHKALRRLSLRRVAPTVLVAAAPPAAVVEALRGAGYLPRHVDEAGAMVVRVGAKGPHASTPVVQARTGSGAFGADDDSASSVFDDDDDFDDDDFDEWAQETRREASTAGVTVELAAAAADRLVAGIAPSATAATATAATALETEIAIFARALSGDEVRQLAYAISHGEAAQIEYRASSGRRTARVVSELVLNGGQLSAWCHLRNGERVFALASILAVSPG